LIFTADLTAVQEFLNHKSGTLSPSVIVIKDKTIERWSEGKRERERKKGRERERGRGEREKNLQKFVFRIKIYSF
jgi:hypothetical protein